MTRDHYLILGVSRDETATGIHAAFRVLAKRYHPDVAGERSAERFRNIVEAYQVLSDPKRRRGYDEGLEQAVLPVAEVRRDRARATMVDRPEPLIPETVSFADEFDIVGPSRENLLERLRCNFTGGPVQHEPAAEPLHVVVSSRREALRGVAKPIQLVVSPQVVSRKSQ